MTDDLATPGAREAQAPDRSTPAPSPSPSSSRVRAFLAMEVLERAQELEREGHDIVHLEVGEPDFDVPACVREAMERAVRDGETHYTHSLGYRELREEIARYYLRRYGLAIEPERVLATAGTSGALVLLMAYLCEAGDVVLVPDPGYPCYANFARAFHAEPRPFRLHPEDGFRYRPREIASLVDRRVRALIVNSPSNPTAVVEERSTLESLASLDVPLVSDEIYHGLEYGPRATSLLEITDRGFVIDGFSKRYAMTGLRIGWLVAPPAAVPVLQKLQQNLFVCASSAAQHGAIAALRHGDDDLAAMREEYARRRRLVLEGLRELRLPVPVEPRGAYYVLADLRQIDGDSYRLARRILEEARVGVTPGIDFGAGAEGFIRLSFAASRERITEGLRRLGSWLERA